jgi:hypothetical protein
VTHDPENELRAMWTEAGVATDQQDAMIRDTIAKAQPGAYVGPFQVPDDVKGATQRKADARLLAPKPQKACDVGLFSDDERQLDLVDMTRRKP